MRYISILMLLASTTSFAQPIIQQEHLPQAGQIFTANNDYQGGDQFLPTPPSSMAQTWDYISAFGTTVAEEVIFLPADQIPGAIHFPNATSGLSYTFGTTVLAIFYAASNEGFKVDGFYTREEGVSTVIIHHYDDIHIPVPLTYGNELTVNVLEDEVKIYDAPGTPAERRRRWTTRTMTADAFGTLITPAWPSGVEVIRHKYDTHLVVDSSFTDASGTGNGAWIFQDVSTLENVEVDYNYLRAGQPIFVMEISGDGSFATYYNSSITTSTGPESDLGRINVLPNPATDQVNFDLGSGGMERIELFDPAGRSVKNVDVRGLERYSMYVADLNAGIYVYRSIRKDGSVHSGRIVITAR